MKKKRLLFVALLAILLIAVMGLAACGRYTNGSDGNSNNVSYTVTFATDGGTAVPTMTVDKGKSITLPITVKGGYIFEGWFDHIKTDGNALTSPYTPTRNIILHAKWRKQIHPVPQYTVTFETNGGTSVSSMTMNAGESIMLPVTAKSGYTFVGWFDNIGLVGNALTSIYAPKNNITLFAKWRKQTQPVQQYTLTFITNGGTVVPAITVDKGESIMLPTTAKSDSIFKGWFDHADLTGNALTSPYAPTSNITLYAKWREQTQPVQQYTVTFESNGGTVVSVITVDKGESIKLPTTAKSDCTFKGWFDHADLTGNALTSPYTPTCNITLYAKWQQQYTVRFVTNGGTPVSVITVDKGESIKLPTTAKSDCTFKGWFDHANLTGNALTSPYTPTCNITLYAKWQQQYTVTFETDGGTPVPSITVNAGESITLPDTSKSGSIFKGWFDHADLTGNALTSPYTPRENVTLYAKFSKEVNLLNYSLNTNGNSYSVTGINDKSVAKIVIPEYYNSKPITGIGDQAFSNYPALTSITFPNSVTHIGKSAFYKCPNLTSIILPDSMSIIDDYAFYKCPALTNITFPNSVTRIGKSAFDECTSLTSIAFPNGATSIGYFAFHDTPWFNNQPNGIIYAGNVVYSKKGFLPTPDITLKDGTLAISDYAFKNCITLNSIKIPNSVSIIGFAAFYNCAGLSNIEIPNGVTTICNSAFLFCSGARSLTIGNSVKIIEGSAFSGCDSLMSITLPNRLTRIDNAAFSYCPALTSITYNGKMSEWDKITKGLDWDLNTGSYTITCTDGKISKKTAKIMNFTGEQVWSYRDRRLSKS